MIVRTSHVDDLPAASPPSTTSALVCICLTDGRYLERIHAHFGIVHLELGVTGVDNVQDTVNCDTLELRTHSISK